MPLAALAIFLALRGVRNADPESTGAAAETARSALDQ